MRNSSRPRASLLIGTIVFAWLAACEPIDYSKPSNETYTGEINDSGVTVFLDDVTFPTRGIVGTTPPAVPTTTTAPTTIPGQDASTGHDVETGVTNTDGAKGFRFVKLASDGSELADQTATYLQTRWSCVYDKRTGLTWENKTPSGLHFYHAYFTWYDSNDATNGGDAGSTGNANICLGTGLTLCNTEAFVKEVNAEFLCGYDDWRVPTREELRSIADYSKTTPPMIDTNFFPYTNTKDHWSSQTAMYSGNGKDSAFEFHFDFGYSEAHLKSQVDVTVRLVRGVQ